MRKIIEGVRSFQEHGFRENQEHFQVLAHGQSPRYLVITCSDSRVVPNLMTGLGPGEIFVIRNAGNIVPPPSAGPSGEAASIEFAVSELKVKHIIVCGHDHCGAMTSLLNRDSLERLPSVAAFLQFAEPAHRTIKTRYPRLKGDEQVTQLVKENVLLQLDHLRSIGSVSASIRQRELQVHGWVFIIETGEVLSYDVTSKRFIPVERWLHERGSSYGAPI
jgi:carbonic anhydrase